MRLLEKISDLEKYIVGIVAFFAIVTFFPFLGNSYFLPKLAIIQIGGCLLFLCEAIKLFYLKTKLGLTSFDLILLSFLIINSLAFFFSHAPYTSFLGIYQNEGMNFFYLPSFLLISAVFHNLNKNQKNTIYLFIIIGTLLSSLYGIYHYYFYATQFGIVDRPSGLDGHPIWSSSTIGFGLLLLLFSPLTLIQNRLNKIYVKIIGTIIHSVALFYLFSTTAWVTILMTLIFYFLLFRIKILQKLDLKKILSVVLVFVIVFLILLRFMQVKNYSIQRRLTEFATIVKLFKTEYISSPERLRYLFLGHGQNTTGFFYIQHKDVKNIADKEWFINLTQLHNQFLELFFTIGFIGTLIWLLLFIKVIIFAFKKKDALLFILVLYLFMWQQLYVLLPVVLMFSFLLMSQGNSTNKILFPPIFIQKYFIPFTYIIISLFIFYVQTKIIYADYLFAQNDIKQAIRTNPNNDEYIRMYTNRLHAELIRCQPTKPDPSLFDCSSEKLKSFALEEFRLLNKAVQINPLNATNWNGLSASAFVLSFLEPENKKYYRNESLKAGIQAYHFNPTEAAYADGLGLIYLELQDYKNAQKYLEIAHILKPDSPEITKHLMEVYKQTNNPKKLLLK